jgi:hypothetical protein
MQRRGDRSSHGVASNDVSQRVDDPVRLNCNRESKYRRLDYAPDERGSLRVVVSHPSRNNKNAARVGHHAEAGVRIQFITPEDKTLQR